LPKRFGREISRNNLSTMKPIRKFMFFSGLNENVFFAFKKNFEIVKMEKKRGIYKGLVKNKTLF
jgi:hypothetical protein